MLIWFIFDGIDFSKISSNRIPGTVELNAGWEVFEGWESWKGKSRQNELETGNP